jgi:hypothetical protein
MVCPTRKKVMGALPRCGEAGGIAKWTTWAARTFIGVDLGQQREYTSIAVLDGWTVETGFDYFNWQKTTEERVAIRHLERMPIGTPYKRIADRLMEIKEELWREPPVAVVVDATGVGAAIVDVIKKRGLGCQVQPITITAGDKAVREKGVWRVPKRDLIAELQVLLESKRLRVAGGIPEAEILLKEMREMRGKVRLTGNEQVTEWREGANDDLVLAVALAYWWMGKGGKSMWARERGYQ